jgi:putative peptidoglycan lipid II flippase
VGVAVNIALSLALFPFVKALGIALATAVAAWVNAGLLGWRLHRLGHLALDDRLRRNLKRIGGASLALGAALAGATALLADALAGSMFAKVAALAVLVVGGAALYGALVMATGIITLDELKRRLAGR